MVSRSPTASPVSVDITAEELELADDAGNPLLSPDELAFDIGNMGGLILGPPSRSSSPLPPSPSSSLDTHDTHEQRMSRTDIPDNEHNNRE
ncbi:hypothetical protein AND_003370 [Anopheles darlingi]|uniref:Uncharacterized protein n=1 Tax=Anopheles darlingi TaxID=43151 RepID=W5JKL8_ANODA|nr:hypothetical protein AND_003370 [Anopheles darlingi]